MVEYITTLVSGGAGVGIGYLAGYSLRKIMKIVAIAVGAFFLGLIYLQSRGWLSIEWNTIEHQGGEFVNGLVNGTLPIDTYETINPIVQNLGISLSAGFAVGFIWGFIKG